MATYWENSCSLGLRCVSWYKCLIVSLVFSHLGFWSGNLFLIAPFHDLCLLVPFKNFQFKNACIMTSGCNFKNGASTQVLRKVRILNKSGLCYTMREIVKIWKNANFVQIVYLLTELYNIFDMAFLLMSVRIYSICDASQPEKIQHIPAFVSLVKMIFYQMMSKN